MPVEAHIIEPLGAYDIVDLKVGKQLLRARTASGFVARAGRQGLGATRPAQTHFFDAATGNSLADEGLVMAHIGLDERHQEVRRAIRRWTTSTSTSPTASSSCCSARPAPARRRRCA